VHRKISAHVTGGGRAKGPACPDPGTRTAIGIRGNFSFHSARPIIRCSAIQRTSMKDTLYTGSFITNAILLGAFSANNFRAFVSEEIYLSFCFVGSDMYKNWCV
jgi:hypothetical protein